MMSGTSFKIGQLAKLTDLNVQTIRYYERRGIIPKPPTRESGYRQYSDADLVRLRFVIHAKEMGFTLREIGELLCLRVDTRTKCGNVQRMAERKIADIETKIYNLSALRKVLLRLTDLCKKDGSHSDCPIIDILENEPKKKKVRA